MPVWFTHKMRRHKNFHSFPCCSKFLSRFYFSSFCCMGSISTNVSPNSSKFFACRTSFVWRQDSSLKHKQDLHALLSQTKRTFLFSASSLAFFSLSHAEIKNPTQLPLGFTPFTRHQEDANGQISINSQLIFPPSLKSLHLSKDTNKTRPRAPAAPRNPPNFLLCPGPTRYGGKRNFSFF